MITVTDDTKGWRRLVLPAVCDIGGESLMPDTTVRQVPMDQMTQGTHACRGHVLEAEADDTRREDEPGDWFVADFDGECSRGGHAFGAKTTVRADGDGGFECRECVDDPAYDEEMFDPELLAKFTASVCADIDRRLAEKGIEL